MALIDNIDELKANNSALSNGIDLENLQSFIDDAINFQVIPAIGEDLLNDIVTKKADSMTVEERRLCDLLIKAVTGFAIANYTDNGAVLIGNSGISVVRSDKSSPASDKKLMQLRKSNMRSAYAALEMAISYVEEKRGVIEFYANSENRKANMSRLINTSTEFQSAGVQIRNDAEVFYSLKPYIDNATATYITPLIGDDILETLLAGIFNHSLSDEQKKLLVKVRRALAFFTMVEAIPYRAVTIDSTGIFEVSETVGGISGNVENRNPATDKRLSSAQTMFAMRGEQELEGLRKFLVKNAGDYSFTVGDDVLFNDGSAPHLYIM